MKKGEERNSSCHLMFKEIITPSIAVITYAIALRACGGCPKVVPPETYLPSKKYIGVKHGSGL